MGKANDIRYQFVKCARLEHTCDLCYKTIEQGKPYLITYQDNICGVGIRKKFHLSCAEKHLDKERKNKGVNKQ